MTDKQAALLRRLRGLYLPTKVVLFRPGGRANPPIAELADFMRYPQALEGRATVYVCRNYACELPTTDGDKMIELLTSGR